MPKGYDVLAQTGGFLSANLIMLRDENADSTRRARSSPSTTTTDGATTTSFLDPGETAIVKDAKASSMSGIRCDRLALSWAMITRMV